jgi:hypothetical protein
MPNNKYSRTWREEREFLFENLRMYGLAVIPLLELFFAIMAVALFISFL